MRDWSSRCARSCSRSSTTCSSRRVGDGSQPFILWKNRQYATHRHDVRSRRAAGRRQSSRRQSERGRSTTTDEDDDDDEEQRIDEPARSSPAPDPDLIGPRRSRGARPLRGGVRPVLPRVPRRLLSLGARPHALQSLEKERQDKGRLLTAGFHNTHGLLPRRPAAVRADPRRRRPARAGRAVARARLHHLRPRAAARRLHLLRAGRVAADDPAAPSSTSPAPRTRTPPPRRRSSGWPRSTWRTPARAWQDDGGDAGVDSRDRGVLRPTSPPTSAASSTRGSAAEPEPPRRARSPSPSAPTAGRLSATERDELVAFYRSLRDEDGLDHESAIRDTVVQRADVAALLLPRRPGRRRAQGVQPLSDYALASRLSYFLWSSMPDDELLARAAAGDLHQPEVLAAQARRMLARRARPRAGRRSSAATGSTSAASRSTTRVDRERFPSFDNELRAGDVRGAGPLLRRRRPARPLGARLPVRQAHVREPVAGQALRHAGCRMAAPTTWVRVDDADRVRPRRPAADGGVPDQERARACAPAR